MLITALLCAAGLWASQTTPQKLALLVGTGPYHTVHEDANHLDFSDDRDVDLVSKALAETSLVPTQNQIQLKGKAATRTNILSGLMKLERQAKPGAVVTIYLSGSTQRVPRSDRSAGWSRNAAAFVPFGQGLILEDDLQDAVETLDKKGASQIVLVLDAGSAGSIRLPPTKTAQCIYLGATEVNEEAQANRFEGSFFTIALCRSLQAVAQEPGTTYTDCVNRIRTQLPELEIGTPQHIVAAGDIKAPLFGRPVIQPSAKAFEFPCRTETPPNYHFGGIAPEPKGEPTAPVQIVEDLECKLKPGSLLVSPDGTVYRAFGRTSQLRFADALYEVGIWDHSKDSKEPFPFQDGMFCLLRPTESRNAESKPKSLRLVGQDPDPPRIGWLLGPESLPGRSLRNELEKLPVEIHDGSASNDDLTMTLPMDSEGNTIRTDRINLFRNSDDSLLAHADLGAATASQVDTKFVDAANRAIKWSLIDHLSNPVTEGELQIRAVPAKVDGYIFVTGLLTSRLDGGRPIELTKDSAVAIEVRSTAPWPAYVQILDLDPNGKTHVLWPSEDSAGPSGWQRLPSDGNWYLLSLLDGFIKESDLKEASDRIEVYHGTPKTDGIGREVWRAIASRDPLDLTPMVAPRRQGPVEKFLESVKPPDSSPDRTDLSRYSDLWTSAEVGLTVTDPHVVETSRTATLLTVSSNATFRALHGALTSGLSHQVVKRDLVLRGAKATKQAILDYLVGPCRNAEVDELLGLAIEGRVIETDQGPTIILPGAKPTNREDLLPVRDLKIALSTVTAQHRILQMNLQGDPIAMYETRMMLTDLDPLASTGVLYLAGEISEPLLDRALSSDVDPISSIAEEINDQLARSGRPPAAFQAGREYSIPNNGPLLLCSPDPNQVRAGSNKTGQSQPAAAWKPGTNYALIVASDKYDSLGTLAYPESDATKLEKLLSERYGFKVRVLPHQSKASIAAAIRSYADPKAYTIRPEDQLFVFFAGHGAFDNVFKEGLICVPESKGAVDEDPAFEHYLQYSTLNTLLNGLPFEHVCLALDVCFGGSFASSVAPARFDEPPDGPSIGNICHVVAMSGDKEVPDVSPFTNHLLDWLLSRPPAKPTFFESIDDPDFENLTPHPSLTYFGKNVRGGKFVLIPVK